MLSKTERDEKDEISLEDLVNECHRILLSFKKDTALVEPWNSTEIKTIFVKNEKCATQLWKS